MARDEERLEADGWFKAGNKSVLTEVTTPIDWNQHTSVNCLYCHNGNTRGGNVVVVEVEVDPTWKILKGKKQNDNK